MNEPELLDGINRAMTTTVQSVEKLQFLLNELSRIGEHVEGVAEQVNYMAMNVAVEALRAEKSATTLVAVAEEAELLENHVLTVLVDLSQQVEGLIRTLHWPVSAAAGYMGVER